MAEQYPVSSAFRENVEHAASEAGFDLNSVPQVKLVVEMVEAYEHGDADLHTVNAGMSIEQYADVAADICFALIAQA